MVVHFKSTSTGSRPENKEKTAELERRFREQEAEKAKNSDKQAFITRRVS